MSEFEGHTPGPWRWTVSDRICSDADESPVLVCRLPLLTDKRGDTPQQTIDRWKADALLIAAAPDLLAERDRLAAENERLREALLNMRSDLREMAERESGNSLYRHFYFRCDEALATTEGEK